MLLLLCHHLLSISNVIWMKYHRPPISLAVEKWNIQNRKLIWKSHHSTLSITADQINIFKTYLVRTWLKNNTSMPSPSKDYAFSTLSVSILFLRYTIPSSKVCSFCSFNNTTQMNGESHSNDCQVNMSVKLRVLESI